MLKNLIISACILFSTAALAEEKINVYTRVPAGETTTVVATAVLKEMNTIFENKYDFRLTIVPGAGGEASDGRALSDARSGANVIVAGSMSSFSMNKILFDSKIDRNVDFVPIQLVAVFPNAIMVNPNAGINSIEDLVNLIKSKPISFLSSTDQATTSNLMLAAFNKRYGITNTKIIRYKRPGELMPSILRGESDFTFTNPIDTNGLRILAVSTKMRSPYLPEVPTGIEIGFTEFDYTLSLMMYIPTVNKEFIKNVREGIHQACKKPDVKDIADKFKMTMVCENDESVIRQDITKFSRLVEEHKDSIK